MQSERLLMQAGKMSNLFVPFTRFRCFKLSNFAIIEVASGRFNLLSLHLVSKRLISVAFTFECIITLSY